MTCNIGRCSGYGALGLRRHPSWRSPWGRSLVCHYSKKNKRENIPGNACTPRMSLLHGTPIVRLSVARCNAWMTMSH